MMEVPDEASGAEAQQIQQNIVSTIQSIRPDGVGLFGQQCMQYGQCGPELMEAKAQEFYDFLMNRLGPEFTQSMLPQLVRLLPAKEKRECLLKKGGFLQPPDAEVPLFFNGTSTPLATGVDEVVRAYNKAVLDGTQTVTWAKLMFIGQGRAGKTSLLRNLTHQGFQADEGITDGADVCIVSKGMWGKTEEMSGGNFDKGVAEVVGGMLKGKSNGGNSKRPWYSRRRYMLVGAVCALTLVGVIFALSPTPSANHVSWLRVSSAGGVFILILSMLCACGGGYTVRQLRRNALAKRRRATALGAIDTSKAVTAEDVIQKMPFDLVVQVAKDGRQEDITLHTWDFGGQQVYYVLHHLFITEGVYCLCFNMLEALNDREECMEYIAFWLNSTYSHVASKDDCSILLVGTHRDIVADPKQHRTISDTLRSQFEQCSFWQCVRQPSPPDCSVAVGSKLSVRELDSSEDGLCFFPVDNTDTTDTTGTTSVMEMISMMTEQQVQAREEKPLRWLKVLDELQKIQEGANYIELGSRTDYSAAAAADDVADVADAAATRWGWLLALVLGIAMACIAGVCTASSCSDGTACTHISNSTIDTCTCGDGSACHGLLKGCAHNVATVPILWLLAAALCILAVYFFFMKGECSSY
jgi:GTPase SAR1 family protein